jgi:hypothetical protein
LRWLHSLSEVIAPQRSGFGTSLLKATFPNARFNFASNGLVCEIEVLLEQSGLGAMRPRRLR